MKTIKKDSYPSVKYYKDLIKKLDKGLKNWKTLCTRQGIKMKQLEKIAECAERYLEFSKPLLRTLGLADTHKQTDLEQALKEWREGK